MKGNFSKKGGTRPPSPREVNSRGSSPAVGRFAPSGLPSLFPRLIEMIRSYILGCLLLVLTSSGCSFTAAPAVTLEMNDRPVIRFGAFPFLDRAVLSNALDPLLKHLQIRLGSPVRLVLVNNYADLEKLIRQKRVDIGWFTPRRGGATKALGLTSVCRPVIGGEGGAYHGIIVARRDRGFTSIRDLAGQAFAYVDRQSKSGFLFPNLLFAEQGVSPLKHFSRVEFVGNHDRCLAGVLDGTFAAAAVTDLMIRSPAWAAHFAQDLTILASTAPILPDPIVVRADDTAIAPASLSEILRGMASSSEGVHALSQLTERIGITGFSSLREGE